MINNPLWRKTNNNNNNNIKLQNCSAKHLADSSRVLFILCTQIAEEWQVSFDSLLWIWCGIFLSQSSIFILACLPPHPLLLAPAPPPHPSDTFKRLPRQSSTAQMISVPQWAGRVAAASATSPRQVLPSRHLTADLLCFLFSCLRRAWPFSPPPSPFKCKPNAPSSICALGVGKNKTYKWGKSGFLCTNSKRQQIAGTKWFFCYSTKLSINQKVAFKGADTDCHCRKKLKPQKQKNGHKTKKQMALVISI